MTLFFSKISLRRLVAMAGSLIVGFTAETFAALQAPLAPPVELFGFSGNANEPAWVAVNDGVMGGVSSGDAKLIAGSLHFRGVLSLENNGGFSSIRSRGPIRNFSKVKSIVLRLKGDGRTYRLQLATNAEFRRARVSYQAEFRTTLGEWTEVSVPLASFVPMFRGQTLSGPPMDRAQIEEIGISLSDGKPGKFLLEIDWISTE
ncbi:MAG: hypothetical protein RL077_1560 [Verrucomicrobiota bacterium]|jgi:monofunctional biosynthetic peptidoglycan transglycosylase